MLQKDFYKNVEKPGALKHILYGDSVSEKSYTVVKFKNSTFVENLPFPVVWRRLIDQGCLINIVDNKEYIFIQDEIQVLGYDVENDQLYLDYPKYLMRHHFEGDLIRLQFTNESCLDVTQNHSMLDYDFKTKSLIKKSPNQMSYVPVIRNQNFIEHDLNLDFFLLGLWYGDGTYYGGSDYYPALSLDNKHFSSTILYYNMILLLGFMIRNIINMIFILITNH